MSFACEFLQRTMFLLGCTGPTNRAANLNNRKLSIESSGCVKSTNCSLHLRRNRSKSVHLFNNKYVRGSLEYHAEELFALSRTYFRLLNNAARNYKLPNVSHEQFEFYSDYGFLRKSLVGFFNNVKETLEDVLMHSKRYAVKNSQLALEVREEVFSFRILLNRIDNLPDFILQNYHSEFGNDCSLASFHIFHVYLELFWLQFIISLQYYAIDELNASENLFDTEDMDTQSIFTKDNKNVNQNVDMEIEWFLYNLISLASKCYDLKGSKGIFSCNCVRDIWQSFQIAVCKMSSENKCTEFWSYYNNIILKYVLQVEEVSPASKKRSNILYKMDRIKSGKRLEFSLALLSKLASLWDSNTQDVTIPKNISNFTILEAILKNIATSNDTISETSMRGIMKQIIKISNLWTEPKSEIITLLWEYFHKRLNSAFSVIGQDDSSTSQKYFYNSSISEIVTDLNFHLSVGDTSKNNMKSENSFSLFVALLGTQMKNSISIGQPSFYLKIKGRIFPKFNLNKIVSLNEFGLKNFSILFLVMAKAVDVVNMELIVQLPFDTLPWAKKEVVLKTHLTILYLFVENGNSISKAGIPVKSIMNKYCNLRDTESMNLTKITLNGYLDILDSSHTFQNDEHVLLDSWVSKYLSVCNLSDLYRVLEMFCALLSKLQILCSYQADSDDSLTSLIDGFFQHILTTVKVLYSNGASVLQIADLAFGFAKFVLENETLSRKYENFQNLLKYFVTTENANERVLRHFLSLILQDDQLLETISNQNKDCQSILIHCWVKCSLTFTEEASDDDIHLTLLISQLEEFSSLNVTPGYGDGEQRNLSKFFYSLGQAWSNSKNDDEKRYRRDKVNQYLHNVEKYVLTIIKTPPSPQYCAQLFIALGSLFLHCSPIIYSRADPTCLLHRLISNVLLPPQLFMNKKHHPHVTSAICRSWYMFMKGLHKLDHKSDIYIEKVMRDMVLQYLPSFVEKSSNKDVPFNVAYRMIPNECSEDLLLEKYILEKLSTFITCRGKQTHVHSTEALCIVHNLANTKNSNLLRTIITCTLASIFEQMMFSDVLHANRRMSDLIVNAVYNNEASRNEFDIKCEVKDILVKTCQKHMAFNSNVFFKFVINLTSSLGNEMIEMFLPILKTEVVKIEKMRGVGFDQGLRNGIRDIEKHVQ